jgi:transposase
MLSFNDDAKIYLKPGTTDMRKSINTLVPIVSREMELNPMESGYFVFCNRTRHLIKILYWDKTGFALWYKRLEKNKFPWPEDAATAKLLTAKQLGWLLEGIDFFKAHESLNFTAGF